LIKLGWLLLFILVVFTAFTLAYTFDGDSVLMEDSQASIRVTPHTATSPINKFSQEFEVCNKTGTDTNLYVGYLFDLGLQSGAVNYWKKPVYGWVEHDYNCQYDFNYILNQDADQNPHYAWCYYTTDTNGSDENVMVFEHEFKTGSIQDSYIVWDVNALVSGNEWLDVTSYFQDNHTTLSWYGDKHIYPFIEGLKVSGNSCEEWRVEYTPNENTDTNKWELWAWAGSSWNCILTDTCDKKLILDPWWDNDWTYKRPIQLPSQDFNKFTTIRVDVNFADLDVLSNLNDLRVVDENLNLVQWHLTDGTSSTEDGNLYFSLNNPINNGDGARNTTYYLYYSNASATPPDFNIYASRANTANFETNTYEGWTLTGNPDIDGSSRLNGKYSINTDDDGAGDAIHRYGMVSLNDSDNDVNYSTLFLTDDSSIDKYALNLYNRGTDKTPCGISVKEGTFWYNNGIAQFDSTIAVANYTIYKFEINYVDSGRCYHTVYEVDGTAIMVTEGDPESGSAEPNEIYVTGTSAGKNGFFDVITFEPALVATGLGSEESGNSAPTMTSIDLNEAYSKQGGDIKATANGTADSESDSLIFVCGTTTNPTIDTNDFCGTAPIASPYSDVSCVGQGGSGDDVNTVYCRLYDGALYSTEETDTYTEDNTAPVISDVNMNYEQNLEGIDYDLNMTIIETGSGLVATTYKCWSADYNETACTSSNWDCKTGSLTDNGDNNYGALIDGTLKDLNGTWTCKGYADDNVSNEGTGTDTETMNELTGFIVDSTSITYTGNQGTTANPATTDQANSYILLTHNGNVDLNLLNLCGDLNFLSYTIPESNHKWYLSDTYGSANTCAGVNQILDDFWDRGAYPTSKSETLYYWLDVPVAQQIGNYSSTITIGASKSGS